MYLRLKDVLIKENVGRKFVFVRLNPVTGKIDMSLKHIATIVWCNKTHQVSYVTYKNIVVNIERILEQDLNGGEYKIKFLDEISKKNLFLLKCRRYINEII